MTRAIVAAMIAVVFMGSGLVTPLYPLYQSAFRFSEFMLTLVYAAYVIGNIIALLFLGRMSDCIGRRPLSIGSVLVCCAATTVFIFSKSIAWLLVARVLSGIGVGLASAAGAAWLADLDSDKARAARSATTANAFGFAAGPLVAGLIAQYARHPLQMPFYVYVPELVIVGALLMRGRETVQSAAASARALFRPRIGIPKEIRRAFLIPAVTAFATFALLGFYAALAPSVLRQSIHQSQPWLAGGVVAELMCVVGFTIVVTRMLDSRMAMLLDTVLLLPSAALLLLAQLRHSWELLIAAAAVAGVACGFGYRGTLQVVHDISPADKRGAVASSYFIICFIGNAVPVIGVGIIADRINPLVASFALVCMITSLAAFALWSQHSSRPAAGR